MRHNRLVLLLYFVAAVTVLAACSGSDSGGTTSTEPAVTTTQAASAAASTVTAVAPSTTAAPATTTTSDADVEGGCDWDSTRLVSTDAGNAPSSQGDDLGVAILGSWQHTFIDSGAGFEPVKRTTDIRYVLTGDRFLYCQDVEGATKQSENSAPLKLEGSEIVLPSPATGYEVTAWDENAMIWLNKRDGSLYLLERR